MNPDFNRSSLNRKEIVSPKAQHVFASVIFSKSVHEMDVKFDMIIRQKIIFGCLQAAYAQEFLLGIPIDGLG